MKNSKTKTILLIIGVIIACLSVLQSFGIIIGDSDKLQNGVFDLEVSIVSMMVTAEKVSTLIF